MIHPEFHLHLQVKTTINLSLHLGMCFWFYIARHRLNPMQK